MSHVAVPAVPSMIKTLVLLLNEKLITEEQWKP
jgi:hypothetical protein